MSIFDPKAATRIQAWDQTIKKQIEIKLITTEHPENVHFTSIADQLKNITSHLNIKQSKMDSAKKELSLPGFRLKENILFCALPLQKELEPFLKTLSYISGSPLNIDAQLKRELDTIDIPVHLKLYIALACPHCPAMVETVVPLALYCKNIHLQIIDGSLFTEQAQTNNILSAPTLILDNDFRWTQNVDNKEIVKMITQRDPSQLSEQTLKMILEQGDAEWITDQMIKKGKIFDGFLKLMLHATWSVRLGAMVVVEDLCEKNPTLAASMCPFLIKQFNGQDITVQGDILYALGESGTNETARWIKEQLCSLTHQELIDAAQDALNTLEALET